ncbi:MAG: alpha-ketoacid dehydrogenase subunit beta [Chloroflexota bacterium]
MREITYSQALNEALREEMLRDPAVFLIGEDLIQPTYGVTRGLYEEFGPLRVICTPISEAARPVAEIMYSDFSTIAMDQIVNQAAKMRYMFGGKARVPWVMRMTTGAGRGNAAQHMQSLEAWFVHVPGLKVVLPSTPYDAKGLLKSSIRDDNPVIFLEHKLLYATKGPVPEGEYTVPLGKADIKRHGEHVTIVATSRQVLFALEAADKLAEEGISAEVIDPRSLMPLDKETILESVKRTHRAVIVHEAVERGGVANWIAAIIQEEVFDYLDAPVVRVCGENVPIPFAQNLEAAAIPNPERIAEAVRKITVL